jgi:hypothetical protein
VHCRPVHCPSLGSADMHDTVCDPALQLAVGLLMLKSELASHSEQNMSLDSGYTLDLASEIFLTFTKKQGKEKMVLLEHEKSRQV